MTVLTRHSSGRYTSSLTTLGNPSVDNRSTCCGSLHEDATILEIEEGKRGEAREDVTSVNARPSVLDTDRGCIVVIEPRLFLRECIRIGMQAKFAQKLDLFASIDEYERQPTSAPVHLIMYSCAGSNNLESDGGQASI